jgi:hypothetical protein
MKTLKDIEQALASPDFKEVAADLERLTKEVHPVLSKFHHSPKAQHCHTECKWVWYLGPDGRPHRKLRCELICPGDKH